MRAIVSGEAPDGSAAGTPGRARSGYCRRAPEREHRMSARRTSRLLADGREIIYFDDTPGAPLRAAVDTRPLGNRAVAGQIRYDALVGDWVAVAGHRLNRTFLPPKDECPLCPTGTG